MKPLPGQARMALILFGPPGSGKGTQAKLLSQRLAVPHVSTGDMLRARIASGDQLGFGLQAIMQAGGLVPDEVVDRMLDDRLGDPDVASGVILDGYPRTLDQARRLDRRLAELGFAPVVIHLKVDYTGIIRRISGRRQCPVCGTVYSVSSNPPQGPAVCDRDGARLAVREDDKEDVVRARLDAYDRQTRPILDHYAASGAAFHQVDGAQGGPEEVFALVCGALGVR